MNAKIAAIEVEVDGINFRFDQYGAIISHGQAATLLQLTEATQLAYTYREGGVCDVCAAQPDAAPCVCGGIGTANAGRQKYRELLFDALRRVSALETTLKLLHQKG
jgi:hypothetical protein